MKFLEFHVPRQGLWQIARGITEAINGRWGAKRIDDEVAELEAENDPLKALGEHIDILIITMGGMYHAAEAAGVPFAELDRMLEAKLALNSRKYPLEYFDGRTPDEAIALCRATWLRRLGDVEESVIE